MMKPFPFRLLLALAALYAASGCLVMDNAYFGLPPGSWRGVLRIEPSFVTPNPKGKPLPDKVDMEYDDVTQGELPFRFTVTYPSRDSFFLTLFLGDKQMILSDYTIGRDFSTAKDTLTIRFPGTKNYIRGIFEEKILEGEWVFPDADGNIGSIPITARHGQDYLFTSLRKPPVSNLSGVWEMALGMEEETQEKARLELEHSGNDLQGILEWQGRRYEYLSGTVQADKLYLSYFDGSTALLLEGKLQEDGTLFGSFRSGSTVKTLWQANKNQRNQ